MKRTLALVLSLLLTFAAVGALADGGYLEQIPQTVFINQNTLAVGGKNVITLSPYYPSSILSHNPYNDQTYTLLTLPEGTQLLGFTTQDCTLFKEDEMATYYYRQYEKDAYETFIDEAELDEYILADGTEGYAAYIDPEDYTPNACALIPTSAHGRTSKLLVKISCYDIRKQSAADKASILTALINAEVERLLSTLTFDTCDYWTKDAFKGFVIHSTDYVLDFALTFPKLQGASGETFEFITSSESDEIKTICNLGNGTLTADYTVDTYSYVDYKKENEPETVRTVELADGNTYEIYSYGFEGESIVCAYIQRTLYDKAGYSNDRNLYLSIELEGDDVYWPGFDDLCDDLNAIVTAIGIEASDITLMGNNAPISLNKTDDPAPAAQPDPEPADEADPEPAAEADGWTCAECGTTGNSGRFCPECGAGKPEEPESGEWFCPECGTKNEGKFCPECGTKKPE